jgi:hypothetical protein
MTSSKADIDKAEHLLYKLYYSLMLSDILYHLGYEATQENKKILHDFHKRILGFETIAGRSHEVVSRFIAECCVFWSEYGIFVRTSGKQPMGIEDMDFNEIKDLL